MVPREWNVFMFDQLNGFAYDKETTTLLSIGCVYKIVKLYNQIYR